MRDEWREGGLQAPPPPAEVSPSSQAARAAAGLSGADSTLSTERNRGQIGLHGALRRRRSGESRALVSGEEPTHNNSGRGALVSYRQREMGAGGQGRHYLYKPAAFEPGAAHRGLPAGRCCGGRHGAGAHKGRRSAARRPQPRAQPGGRRPPPGAAKLRGSNFTRRASRFFLTTNETGTRPKHKL